MAIIKSHDIIISEDLSRGDPAKIVVSVSEWSGEKRLDVRLYYKKGEQWRATKAGFVAPMRLLGEFVDAFKDLHQAWVDGDFEKKKRW